MSLGVFLDVVIVALLVAAIWIGIVLNRRLAAFRAAREEFEQVIERFNTAATRAEAGVNALKLTGDATGRALQQAVTRAQSLRDELSFLIDRAEPMVDRMSSAHRAATARAAVAPAPAAAAPSEPPRAAAPVKTEAAAPSMPIPSAETDLLKSLSNLR